MMLTSGFIAGGCIEAVILNWIAAFYFLCRYYLLMIKIKLYEQNQKTQSGNFLLKALFNFNLLIYFNEFGKIRSQNAFQLTKVAFPCFGKYKTKQREIINIHFA